MLRATPAGPTQAFSRLGINTFLVGKFLLLCHQKTALCCMLIPFHIKPGNAARFILRISAVSNAIETIDNEMICFIIYCLNCIRHGRNATYESGLR